MGSLQFERGIVAQQAATHQDKTSWRAIAAAVMATFANATPGFATGALAGPITKEFGVNAAVFGFVLACFFAFTAIGSPFSARLAERLPPAVQLALATFVAGMVMIGMSQISSIRTAIALLALGGLANSLVQPAVGRILNSQVSIRRLSLASGVVQAASGAATLPSALLLQFLADPYGWRVAFLTGGFLVTFSALTAVLARNKRSAQLAEVPQREREREREGETAASTASSHAVLPLWTLGAAFATVGVTGVASFMVLIATTHGLSVSSAGTLVLTFAGLVAVVRVSLGFLVDKRPHLNIPLVIGMMGVGMIGLILMSFKPLSVFLFGLFFIIIGLFGWNGLLVGASIRFLPGSAARTLGALQLGFFTGATLAPITFGVLINTVGMQGALVTAAASAAVGAFMIGLGERTRLRLGRPHTPLVCKKTSPTS